MMINPYKFFLLIAIILSAGIAAVLWHYTPMHPLLIYVTAMTLLTFAFYGYDKHRAIHQGGRVPEAVLHFFALAGGTMGALAGQIVFRHKTKKAKFRAIFAAIAALQLGCAVWWVLYKLRL